MALSGHQNAKGGGGGGDRTRRRPTSLFASCLLFVFVANASDKGAPAQQAIKEILAGVKRWTFVFEFTPENLPIDRASSTEFEFFWRGSEFVGRTTKFVGASSN
jgi:hypothetical protein